MLIREFERQTGDAIDGVQLTSINKAENANWANWDNFSVADETKKETKIHIATEIVWKSTQIEPRSAKCAILSAAANN